MKRRPKPTPITTLGRRIEETAGKPEAAWVKWLWFGAGVGSVFFGIGVGVYVGKQDVANRNSTSASASPTTTAATPEPKVYFFQSGYYVSINKESVYVRLPDKTHWRTYKLDHEWTPVPSLPAVRLQSDSTRTPWAER